MYQEGGGAAVMERHGIGMDPALWEYYCRTMKAGAARMPATEPASPDVGPSRR
jgi:hypothetical protein